MPIEKIRAALAEGRLRQALEATQALARQINDNDLGNTLILLMSRYNGNENQNNNGLVTNDTYAREKARINHALLATLADVRIPAGVVVDIDAQLKPPPTPDPAPQITPPVPPASSEQKILLFSAVPREYANLDVNAEYAFINEELNNYKTGGQFNIQHIKAVTAREMMRKILDHHPQIVHFSGHGTDEAMIDDQAAARTTGRPPQGVTPKKVSGIYVFDDDRRHAKLLETDFLDNLFSLAADEDVPVNLVIFNACYSANQAESISKYVPYVIGTSSAVKDKAALAFAGGFYYGLADGKSIPSAFKRGVLMATSEGEPRDRFVLYENGVKV